MEKISNALECLPWLGNKWAKHIFCELLLLFLFRYFNKVTSITHCHETPKSLISFDFLLLLLDISHIVLFHHIIHFIWVSWLLPISPHLWGRSFLLLFLTEFVCSWRYDTVCSLILMPSHTRPSTSLLPCGMFIRLVSVWATLEFKAFRQLIRMAPKWCIVQMKTVCIILIPADDDICVQRFKNRPRPQKQAVVEWGLTTCFIVV